jgi:regulatory protein
VFSDNSFFSIKAAYLSDGFMSSLSQAVLPLELSEEEENEVRFSRDCLRAERAALSLAAYAEQTCAGVARKLEGRGHSSSCVKAVVSYLSDMDIVNDRRYAALWVQSRLSAKADSPKKLLSALINKGISRDSAQNVLKDALDFEKSAVLLKKYSAKHGLEREEKRVRRQKLKNEGFSPEVIQAVEEEEEKNE